MFMSDFEGMIELKCVNQRMTVKDCIERASQFDMGDRVYMWDFYSKAIAKSACYPHEPIIGEVTGIEEFGKVRLYTDEGLSFLGASSHIFHVDTGPAVGETR